MHTPACQTLESESNVRSITAKSVAFQRRCVGIVPTKNFSPGRLLAEKCGVGTLGQMPGDEPTADCSCLVACWYLAQKPIRSRRCKSLVLIRPCWPVLPTQNHLFLSGRARRGVRPTAIGKGSVRSEEHTSELQSHSDIVCRLLLEIKK